MSETDVPMSSGSAASDTPPLSRTTAPSLPDQVLGDTVPGVTVTDTAPPLTPGTPPTPAAVSAPKLTRRGRLRKWDRPPPPHDWRWYVGNLGKTLITLGILMFAFVAYQLWGTGIENARAQNKLENDFEELLASTPPVEFDADFAIIESDAPDTGVADPAAADTKDPAVTESVPADSVDAEPVDQAEREPALADSGDVEAPVLEAQPVVPVEDQNIPLLENGDALARIEIPRIGVNDIVVAGIETGDLKKGPGHFPDTPLPGQLGNAAIAGHRTTYGQPFHDVDKLQLGDDIRITTLNGEFTYKVTGQQIVSPADYQVISTSDPTRATITLVSCHPKWTAQQRIIITGELAPTASAPVGEPVLNYGRPAEPVASTEIALPSEGLDVADGVDGSPAGSGAVSGNLAADDVDGAVPDDGITGNLADSPQSDVDRLGTAETNEGIADAFADGWFSDPAANPHVGLWGLVVAAIAIGAYLLSRRTRRDWVGGLVGFIPFIVALYFFFQNVNRLLPPNL